MQAMELLDRRFGDYRLREYAVGCLEAFSDDELAEFLLQLAQVLKYEAYHASALANFLLRRGLQNPRKVGMKLFWTLRSEMHLVKFATRFGILLKAYLQSCGTHRGELTRQFDVQNLLKTVADSVLKVKGDKAERNQVGRMLLDTNGQLPSEFQISLDSRIKVSSMHRKCRVMNSKKKPLFLCLRTSTRRRRAGSLTDDVQVGRRPSPGSDDAPNHPHYGSNMAEQWHGLVHVAVRVRVDGRRAWHA